MTGSTLKSIAILAMLIDHIGAVLFPELLVLRIIGRLAFPIFAFLLVQGYHYTGDLKRYILRLLIFAAISEIPFDLAFHGEMFYWSYQNIFFTLALGLIALALYDRERKEKPLSAWVMFFAIAIVSEYLRVDYGILGMFTILFFHMHWDDLIIGMRKVALLHVLYGVLGSGLLFGTFELRGSLQAFAAASVLLLARYNGEKGIGLKYAFYAFYPVHLLLLAVVGAGI